MGRGFHIKVGTYSLVYMPHDIHMFFSVTLGGFGADRFYLEQYGSAVGKLLSFGGLGVWSIIDVILVATGYLTPANGSAFI